MEIEIKLSVSRDLPGGAERLWEWLRSLPALDGYTLGLPVAVSIRDVYFDTPDGALGRRRTAVRLRQQDGQALVTVKVGRRQQDGLSVREELELPLTPANLEQALGFLRSRRLLDVEWVDEQRFAAGEPCGTLVPVLDTQTRRWARAVRHSGGVCIAELTMDRVTYAGLAQPFYDVEVELKGPGTESDLSSLQTALLGAAPALRPAGESKLARGLRILAEMGEQP